MNKNKTPFHLVGLDFIAAIADIFQKGLKNGRKPFDWQQLKWTKEMHDQYCDAAIRHIQQATKHKNDRRSLTHWASVAANAYIIWWHNRNSIEATKVIRKP